jgi:hypothetical protein
MVPDKEGTHALQLGDQGGLSFDEIRTCVSFMRRLGINSGQFFIAEYFTATWKKVGEFADIPERGRGCCRGSESSNLENALPPYHYRSHRLTKAAIISSRFL